MLPTRRNTPTECPGGPKKASVCGCYWTDGNPSSGNWGLLRYLKNTAFCVHHSNTRISQRKMQNSDEGEMQKILISISWSHNNGCKGLSWKGQKWETCQPWPRPPPIHMSAGCRTGEYIMAVSFQSTRNYLQDLSESHPLLHTKCYTMAGMIATEITYVREWDY